MVEGTRVQATPSAPILSPRRLTHSRGVTVSPPPHQSVLSVGPLATPATLTHLGWVLDLESSSPVGWTLFSATSVSTENVGSTMKSMKPAVHVTGRRLTWGAAQRTRPAHRCLQPHGTQSPGAQRFPVRATFVMMSL